MYVGADIAPVAFTLAPPPKAVATAASVAANTVEVEYTAAKANTIFATFIDSPIYVSFRDTKDRLSPSLSRNSKQ